MSWDGCYDWETKNDVINDIIKTLNTHPNHLIKHQVIGNHFWFVADSVEGKFIGLYLLSKDRRDGIWMRNGMCEESEPYYYDCPLSFLGLAPVASEDWRKKVREYHTGKKQRKEMLSKIRRGTILALNNSRNYKVTETNGKKIFAIELPHGTTLYRIPKTRIIGIINNIE